MERTSWDERFTAMEGLYGEGPNLFFKEFLEGREPGRLFLPGEGEGRNALYAARLGWQVTACDYSEVGRAHALARAAQAELKIEYHIADLAEYLPPGNTFDLIASIFCHLPGAVRGSFHRRCVESLVAGGHFILEAFAKEQLNYGSGGPKDIGMLYSVEELRGDFRELEIVSLKRQKVVLDEGPKHQGAGQVVRLIARKR